MEYRGKEVGKPTLEMVEEYIKRERFTFPAQIAYNHLEKELWQNRKGQPYQSLEVPLNIYNGVWVQRQRRNSGFAGSFF